MPKISKPTTKKTVKTTKVATTTQKLSKAKIPDGIKIGLVVRDKEVFVPTKETVFNLNDTIILLSSRDNLTKIEELFKISPYF